MGTEKPTSEESKTTKTDAGLSKVEDPNASTETTSTDDTKTATE